MNPYELERLAKQRTADVRGTAGIRRARCRDGAARRGQARSIRHRTGWALIQIGLSLISAPARGSGVPPAVGAAGPS